MFRTASRLPRRTVLSATAAAIAVGLHEPQAKLSIYSSPTPDILLVDSPSELEKQIGGVRRQVQNTYSEAHSHVQGWVSKWIGVEHAVEHRVKSIIAPDEPLTPGLLYVGISTLTGSIISRNRFLPTRLLLPPIFLIASAQHFLPKSTHNLSSYFGNLEETYFPTLAEKHEIAKSHSHMAWERVKEATRDGRGQIGKAATGAVDKVQEMTGLKLRETLGWGKEKAKVVETVVEAKLESVKVDVETKAEKKIDEVEKKVEEVKRVV